MTEHSFPMNRWYVSRYLRSASRQDFTDGINAMRDCLTLLTKRQYDLSVVFYRAADPESLRLSENAPRPAVVIDRTDSINGITSQRWNNADYTEATLTLRPEPDKLVSFPCKYESATVTALWPDRRRMDFRVEPKQYGREISRQFFDSYFHMWTRGYDFN